MTGIFKYTGTSSACTNATVKATSSVNDWKVISKSRNKVIGKAIMKQYVRDKVVNTKYPSVTLTYSETGKLSHKRKNHISPF